MGRLHITYTADPVLHRLHSETLHAIITWLSVQSRLYHVHGIPGTSQAPQRDLTRHYHMAFSPIATAYHWLHSETLSGHISHGFQSKRDCIFVHRTPGTSQAPQ